jgi:hypothetical protein
MRMLPFMVMPAYNYFFYKRDEGLIKKNPFDNIIHYFLKQMRRFYDQESNVII